MTPPLSPTVLSPAAQIPRVATGGLWWLLAATALLRLPGIARPLTGEFATKNAAYAMIARNWAEGRAAAWFPTVDCLTGGERGLHMLDFPASAYLTGALWRVGGGSLEIWGRLTSIAFITAAVGLMFLLVRRWHGTAAGWGAATMLALSPISIIYGQSFMLEASLVFWMLAAFYCAQRWRDGRSTGWLAGAACCLGWLVLSKAFLAVMVLPLAALCWQRTSDAAARPRAWLLPLLAGGLALMPAAAWYGLAYYCGGPESPWAEHVYDSVRKSAGVHRPPHPLLFQLDFYRQGLDHVTGLVLTPLGFGLAMLGLAGTAWRRHAAWLAACGLLAVLLPLKFHHQSYYYLNLLPALCVLAGLGWQRLAEHAPAGRLATAGLLSVALLCSLRYAARPAFVTPPEDRSVTAAAAALRGLTAAEEPVATMHGSTIDLLYYCHRPGWALAPEHAELAAHLLACRRGGARFLVVAGLEQLARPPAQAALRPLKLIHSGEDFCIYRLPDAAPAAAERGFSTGHRRQ